MDYCKEPKFVEKETYQVKVTFLASNDTLTYQATGVGCCEYYKAGEIDLDNSAQHNQTV
jgi:hypothetical protein